MRRGAPRVLDQEKHGYVLSKLEAHGTHPEARMRAPGSLWLKNDEATYKCCICFVGKFCRLASGRTKASVQNLFPVTSGSGKIMQAWVVQMETKRRKRQSEP